jgi:hypothetical protein
MTSTGVCMSGRRAPNVPGTIRTIEAATSARNTETKTRFQKLSLRAGIMPVKT